MKGLYLDDKRNPYDKELVVVRDFKEFVEHIEKKGIPEYISFDHDLHPEHYSKYMFYSQVEPYNALYDHFNYPTGLHAAMWLCKLLKSESGDFPICNVHSANPIGSSNIFWELSNFYVSCGKNLDMITKNKILHT